jgi:hypothetical protein
MGMMQIRNRLATNEQAIVLAAMGSPEVEECASKNDCICSACGGTGDMISAEMSNSCGDALGKQIVHFHLARHASPISCPMGFIMMNCWCAHLKEYGSEAENGRRGERERERKRDG